MTHVVVYAHDFETRPETGHVENLTSAGFRVVAFKLNFRYPVLSAKKFNDVIVDQLIEYLHVGPLKINFLGVGLGAWYAKNISSTFGEGATMINPPRSPSQALIRRGVPANIANLYDPIEFESRDEIFVSSRIGSDHSEGVIFGNARVHQIEGADNRFHMPWFQGVIDHLLWHGENN